MRNVAIVLSARSLPYAGPCLESLLRSTLEPLHLRLITDGPDDKQQIQQATASLDEAQRHCIEVHDRRDVDVLAEETYRRHEYIQRFRDGHPCWRKITDPVLFARDGQEMIVVDPDVYFPNRFCFEATPRLGILLMYQPPNCLFPPAVVRAAFAHGVRLANHVDIGVGHWREPLDLDWLDWLIATLGGSALPRVPHVEAICWAALAMRLGGGYLDPGHWICWRKSLTDRILLRIGYSPLRHFGSQVRRHARCFHAGGEAKDLIPHAQALGILDSHEGPADPCQPTPFVELTPRHYEMEQRLKTAAYRLGLAPCPDYSSASNAPMS